MNDSKYDNISVGNLNDKQLNIVKILIRLFSFAYENVECLIFGAIGLLNG